MLDWIRRLFVYDAWANRETLGSLRALPPSTSRPVELLAHIIAAEWLWLGRLTRTPSALAVWPDLTPGECDAELSRLPGAWNSYLDSLSDGGLRASVDYTNSKGERWTSAVEDILVHVPMHSSYHRGQIAAAVRAAGHVPAYTDFIHAARQQLIE